MYFPPWLSDIKQSNIFSLPPYKENQASSFQKQQCLERYNINNINNNEIIPIAE